MADGDPRVTNLTPEEVAQIRDQVRVLLPE